MNSPVQVSGARPASNCGVHGKRSAAAKTAIIGHSKIDFSTQSRMLLVEVSQRAYGGNRIGSKEVRGRIST